MNHKTEVLKYFDYSVFLHFLGRGLYSVFVPILLLKNGYPLTAVFLFLLFSAVVTILSNITGVKFLKLQKIFYFNFLSSLAELGLIMLLLVNSFHYAVFVLLFLLDGFYYAFYYLSYRGIIISHTSGQNSFKNTINVSMAVEWAGLITPILGAILLSLGKPYLLFAGALLILISLVPIYKVLHHEIEIRKNSFPSISALKYPLLYYGLVGSVQTVLFTLWGIFIYLSNYSLFYVSLIPASTSVLSLILLKTLKEKTGSPALSKNLILTGLLLVALVSVWRFLSPSYILFSNILASLAFLFLRVPVEAKLYDQLKDHDLYYSSALMEIVPFTAVILTLIVVMFLGLKYALLLPIFYLPIYILMHKKL